MWRFCSSPWSEAAKSPSGARARAPHKAEGWGLTCSGRRRLSGRGSPSLLLPRLCADQSLGPLAPAPQEVPLPCPSFLWLITPLRTRWALGPVCGARLLPEAPQPLPPFSHFHGYVAPTANHQPGGANAKERGAKISLVCPAVAPAEPRKEHEARSLCPLPAHGEGPSETGLTPGRSKHSAGAEQGPQGGVFRTSQRPGALPALRAAWGELPESGG